MAMLNRKALILNLEDNQDIAGLINLVLRRAPADVINVQNADEAWVAIDQQIPDLILLDMMLPGISGLDFLSQIRQDGRLSNTPVIVISIRADANYRSRAQELGVARYLLKPFSPAVLRQEVEQALGVDWKEYW